MTRQRESGFVQPAAFAWNALAMGLGTAAVATAIWVALTIIGDGHTTYHLFPLVIAASAAVTSRYVMTGPLRAIEALGGAAIGIAGVLAGWLVLEVVNDWPSATFFNDQPGGIAGETVLLAAVGALIGALYAANWRS